MNNKQTYCNARRKGCFTMDALHKERSTKKITEYLLKYYNDNELAAKGIYSVRNKSTNEVYIGSTEQTFGRRWFQLINKLIFDKHLNFKLQDSWNEYGFTEFEFKILKTFYGVLNKEQLGKEVEKCVLSHLENNIKVFNSVFDSNICLYQGSKTLELCSKEQFTILFQDLLLKHDLDSELIDGLFESSLDEIEMFSECINNITPSELEGIKRFLYLNSNGNSVVVEHDTFDISKCSLEKCINYDEENYYCKLRNEYINDFKLTHMCVLD